MYLSLILIYQVYLHFTDLFVDKRVKLSFRFCLSQFGSDFVVAVVVLDFFVGSKTELEGTKNKI